MVEKTQAIKTKCPKCGYTWPCRSTMVLATCPSCMKRFPREANQVKE